MWKAFAFVVAFATVMPKYVAGFTAIDSAGDPAYTAEAGGAWKGFGATSNENPAGTDNGGHGFMPWNFAGGYHDPTRSPYDRLNHFIDGVDFPASAYNHLAAPAFGLTNANISNVGITSRATRVFSVPLAIGGTVSLEFDNPVLAPSGINDETGYLIRLNSGGGPKIPSNPNVKERVGLFAFHGFDSGRWNITNSQGVTSSGLHTLATNSGAKLQVTLTTESSYRLEILPLAGGPPLFISTGNLIGVTSAAIDTLEIAMFGNGSGNGQTGATAAPTGQREFFFDNLLVQNPQSVPPGDFNRNGIVDTADYVIWRRGLGTDYTIEQHSLWQANFGAKASGTAASTTVVPEPLAMVSIILGAILAANRLVRRSRRR